MRADRRVTDIYDVHKVANVEKRFPESGSMRRAAPAFVLYGCGEEVKIQAFDTINTLL